MATVSVEKGTVAQQIARFVHDLSLDDVPDPVRKRAKLHLLDALGIGIASSGMDFGESVHRASSRLGDSAESSVLGFGTQLPASSAALANGTLIHGLDFDDTHIQAIHHATAPALAAALAVGEAEHADGSSVLLAYIIGLEIGCRLAAAAPGEFHDRGLHPTGIMGTFAAACAAGKLREVGPETLVNAMGLCGSQAAGILEMNRSWLKRFHPGWAAHAGIIASTLAEEKFLGPVTVFEGSKGLYASHLGRVPNVEALSLNDFGTRWMCSEIALKPYPCCHFLHAFIEAALHLREAHGVNPEDIARIVCPVSERLIPVVTEPIAEKTAPGTIYDALFSLQYSVALAIVRHRVDLSTYYDNPVDDPAVMALACRVVCHPDPKSDYPLHFPGEVEMHLNDGRVLRHRLASSLGSPERPLSENQVKAKFHANAEREMSVQGAQKVVNTVDRIEGLPDIGELLVACSTSRASDASPLDLKRKVPNL